MPRFPMQVSQSVSVAPSCPFVNIRNDPDCTQFRSRQMTNAFSANDLDAIPDFETHEIITHDILPLVDCAYGRYPLRKVTAVSSLLTDRTPTTLQYAIAPKKARRDPIGKDRGVAGRATINLPVPAVFVVKLNDH